MFWGYKIIESKIVSICFVCDFVRLWCDFAKANVEPPKPSAEGSIPSAPAKKTTATLIQVAVVFYLTVT